MAQRIKDINVNESSAPLGLRAFSTFADLDLTSLVALRRAHQTEQAAKSARTRTGIVDTTAEDDASKASNDEDPTVVRKKIMEAFNTILREKKNHAATPGSIARAERWTSRDVTDKSNNTPVADPVSGNAANAQAVAAVSATKDATKRKTIFRQLEVPHLNLIADARVSSVRPIHPGDFVFFLTDSPRPGTVSVGQVTALYTRTTGKGVRNAAASHATNVSALARIALQVFEHSHFNQFTSIPTATAGLSTNRFLLVPPYQILFLLSNAPSRSSDTATSVTAPIRISSADYKYWTTLKASGPSFVLALKAFRKRKKGDDDSEQE